MKRFWVCLISLLLLVCPWAISFPATALAAGASVTISVMPQTVQVGDIITVNLTFSASSAIGSFQAGLTYDDSRLEYVSGGGNAVELSGGTGGIVDNGSADTKVLSYSLRFRAIGTGQASFTVTDTEINDYNTGENLGNLYKSKTIPISENTATPVVPTPTPSSGEPIPVSIDGKTLYVLRDLQDAALPEGYDCVSISYHGADIHAAYHPSGLLLLLVMDANGNEEFYIFDDDLDVLYPYVTIAAGGDHTILPLGDVNATGYAPASVTIGNQTVSALAAESNAGLYLVHAMNSQGTSGYYFYDATEDTMQRAWVLSTGAPEADPADAAEEPQPFLWLLFLIPAGICILLLALNILQFRRNKNT